VTQLNLLAMLANKLLELLIASKRLLPRTLPLRSTNPAQSGERLRPSWPTASACDNWVDSLAHRKSS
jgi:hypothetical protein